MSDLAELVDMQISTQGVASFRATNGHVFVFPLDVLQKLVAAAEKEGRAIVFVRHGPES